MVGVGVSVISGMTIGIVAGASLVLHSLMMLIIWPTLEYRAFRYAVREHDLLVRSGVLFRRWTSIPLNRIQHLDTRQGPLERILGLSRLQVYTAAGVSADGSIPGLAEPIAELFTMGGKTSEVLSPPPGYAKIDADLNAGARSAAPSPWPGRTVLTECA